PSEGRTDPHEGQRGRRCAQQNPRTGRRLMSQSATAGPAPRVIADQPSRVTRRARRKALRPFLMAGGIVAVIAASGAYWVMSGRIVSIDDAYVRAAKLAVSTDVSGIVTEVAVKEGQRVKKGEILFRLDPMPFQ